MNAPFPIGGTTLGTIYVVGGDGGKHRPHAGEVEYQGNDNRWHLATGPSGDVTKAKYAYDMRSGKHPKMPEVIERVRAYFVFFNRYTLREELVDVRWQWNDFGRWGWNLKRNYQRTTMYIHTSPYHEQFTAEHRENEIMLSNSHGCVRIKPADRDKMEQAGYLNEGTVFEVRRYGELGPP